MMGRKQITVADQTLCLCFDGDSGRGMLVRLDDGLEASFNSSECLLHLIEGMVGWRTWQVHRERIEAELAQVREGD